MGFKTEHSHKKTISFWQHDCTDCTFLGSFVNDNEKYDLYWCIKDHITVIARYGDEPHENVSGCGLTHPALIEAEKRALMFHMPLSKPDGTAVDWDKYKFYGL